MSQEVERRMTANEPPLPDFVIVQKGEKMYPDGEYLNLEKGTLEWGSLGGLWGGCTIELSQGRLIPHE